MSFVFAAKELWLHLIYQFEKSKLNIHKLAQFLYTSKQTYFWCDQNELNKIRTSSETIELIVSDP